MIEIIQSETFKQWLFGLKDRTARARILIRIKRIETGDLGDVKPVGEGISELLVDHGPGIGCILCNENNAPLFFSMVGTNRPRHVILIVQG